MDSGHGQTLSATDFQSATILSTETSAMLSQQDSSRSVSIRDALPTYAKELIAGGAAGGIAKTIVAPLERVKILYQVTISRSLHAASLGQTFPVTSLPTSYAGLHFMAFNVEKHVLSVGSSSLFKSARIEKIKDAALVD